MNVDEKTDIKQEDELLVYEQLELMLRHGVSIQRPKNHPSGMMHQSKFIQRMNKGPA